MSTASQPTPPAPSVAAPPLSLAPSDSGGIREVLVLAYPVILTQISMTTMGIVDSIMVGSLGATGHVTQPHLHFHLADANAPLAAESLAYVLRYTPLGAYDTIEAFRAAESWNPHTGSIATPSFPSPMMVVEFPE